MVVDAGGCTSLLLYILPRHSVQFELVTARKSVPIFAVALTGQSLVCHTQCMTLTETFASTVALTIPVLMVAGAIELRSLADAVNKRSTEWAKIMVSQLSVSYLTQLVSDENLEQSDHFRSTLVLIKLVSGGYAIFAPIVWSIALLYSAVIEVLCLLYLVGVYTDSALIILSIIAVAVMIAPLAIFPIIQAIFFTQSSVFRKLNAKHISAQIRQEVPSADEFRQLSVEDQKKKVERIKSMIFDTSYENLTKE
jgi:hypothetical protein